MCTNAIPCYILLKISPGCQVLCGISVFLSLFLIKNCNKLASQSMNYTFCTLSSDIYCVYLSLLSSIGISYDLENKYSV